MVVFAAALLAGGQSRRMGQDKALLPVGQGTLLTAMSQLLHLSGARQMMVLRNKPGYLADNYPGSGPLAGIEAAITTLLQQAEHPHWLLVVPVDMPLLTAAHLRQLVAQAPDWSAVAFQGSYLPCVLPVNPAVQQWLRAELQDPQGERRVQALLRRLHYASIPGAPPWVLQNLNTPAQWAAASAPAADSALSLTKTYAGEPVAHE